MSPARLTPNAARIIRMDRLFIWLSPTFPVGSFAYSHGLEWAQQARLVTGAASLQDWLSDLITHGSWANDALIFAAAHRAVLAGDGRDLAGIAELSLALCAAKERYQEAVQQGNAMMIAARSAWPCAALELVERDVPYAVALAVLSAGHGFSVEQVLPLYGMSFVQNLVSASIRLGIVGQTAGQKILAALRPIVQNQAQKAVQSTLDDLANAALTSDFASMQHETQYTRIFRS